MTGGKEIGAGMKERIGVILLAGGIGKRTGRKVPKQLLLIGGKPMIVHSLEKIEALPEVQQVVIPCAEEAMQQTREVLDAWGFAGDGYVLVPGGATRQESVAKGLEALHGCDSVIIHESARPFVTVGDFRRLIDAEAANAILGMPVPFTVAQVGESGELAGTFERSTLVNVQLPQIFDYALLREAHARAAAAGKAYTEDATLLLDETGVASSVLPGHETNIKITYPSDLVIAEAVYRNYIAGGTDE